MSPGNLYRYFPSKEALIAGIAERDRNKLAGQLAELAKAPDLTTALGRLGEHYAVDEPQYKRLMCIEIGVESTRNEAVGNIYRSVDRFVLDSFEQLFQRAEAEGRIRPELDPKTLTWDNAYPTGKDWGPVTGPCKARPAPIASPCATA